MKLVDKTISEYKVTIAQKHKTNNRKLMKTVINGKKQ